MNALARIILDVDGVAADFIGHLLATFAGFGIDLSKEQITTWDAIEELGHKKLQDFFLADPEWWRDLPVIEGSKYGVRALLKAGHEIVWTTTPWFDCEMWCEVRREWLCGNFGAPDSQIVFCVRKELICGDVIIDDNARNVEAWLREYLPLNGDAFAVLVDRPWNQEAMIDRDHCVRASDWEEIVSAVKREVE